jgi:xanthine/CO dehydrogenase XdhC/CoxF family maturation factor
MKDIHDILRAWRSRPGESFALATLVHVEGSSYRRAGARMLVCQDGTMLGSLSGGCIEEEVALTARDVLRTGAPATMTFDTRRRFGCHGKIDIFIERVSETFLADLAQHLKARRSCTVVTKPDGSSVGEAVSFPTNASRESGSFPSSPLCQEIHPPLRLLIFGAGPDSAPLAQLGELLGWEPVQIVDSNSFSIEADAWTAAVVKSHNYGRDFSALQKLLPLNLRYVGLIGPRKRRDQLLNGLLDVGVVMNAGFFAPAGLDLGADTPEEIALSIVSEIQSVFAQASGDPLRDRKVPIHDARAKLPPVSPASCKISAP